MSHAMISMTKRYRTRDGRPYRLLCIDRKGPYPVAGFVGEDESLFITHSSDGAYLPSRGPHPDDLIEIPELDSSEERIRELEEELVRLRTGARKIVTPDGMELTAFGGVAELKAENSKLREALDAYQKWEAMVRENDQSDRAFQERVEALTRARDLARRALAETSTPT